MNYLQKLTQDVEKEYLVCSNTYIILKIKNQ